jgi:tetratricopeptide (TPR) repeat protein
MKKRKRRIIVLPIVAALLCVAAIIALLWWQLRLSGTEILGQKENPDDGPKPIVPQTIVSDAVDPRDFSLLHLRKGDLAVLQGDWKTAEDEYRQSVDAGGGLPALRKLAQAQLQRGQVEPLRRTVERMKEEGAKQEDVMLIDAIVALRTGDLASARAVLEPAEDTPQKHYGLGLVNILEGNHEKAIEELTITEEGWEPVLRTYAKTLKTAYSEYALFPDSPNIHLVTLIARALAQVQECALALPLLEQVTAAQDDYRDAWIVRGYCELTSELSEAALATFEKAYSLDPQKPEVQYFLARAYAALGDHGNAITFLQYALKNGFQPEQEVRRVLAKEALAIGDGTLALEQYRALTQFSDAEFETYQNVVALSADAGEMEAAYETALQAAQKWPEDARAHDLFGWAALRTGREDEARAALEQALALDPDLESAHDHMRELR